MAGYADADRAVPFAPGIVNLTDRADLGSARCVFSPEGAEMLYARFEGEKMNIVMRRFADGHWGGESVAPFSGGGLDFEPCYAADGSRVYFTSKRGGKGFHLWSCTRGKAGWGEAQRLTGAMGSPDNELFSRPEGSDFYFVSNRAGGLGGMDLYVAHGFDGQGAASAENLGSPVNASGTEFDPCPDPQGRFLIFSRDGDLYLSRRTEKGGWSEPVSLGPAVNRPDLYEVAPTLVMDGQVLLFTRFGKDTPPNVFAIGTRWIPAIAGK